MIYSVIMQNGTEHKTLSSGCFGGLNQLKNALRVREHIAAGRTSGPEPKFLGTPLGSTLASITPDWVTYSIPINTRTDSKPLLEFAKVPAIARYLHTTSTQDGCITFYINAKHPSDAILQTFFLLRRKAQSLSSQYSDLLAHINKAESVGAGPVAALIYSDIYKYMGQPAPGTSQWRSLSDGCITSASTFTAADMFNLVNYISEEGITGEQEPFAKQKGYCRDYDLIGFYSNSKKRWGKSELNVPLLDYLANARVQKNESYVRHPKAVVLTKVLEFIEWCVANKDVESIKDLDSITPVEPLPPVEATTGSTPAW